MVDVSWVSGFAKMMYSDKLSIYRYTSVEDAGVTLQELKTTPEMSDIPCLISFSKQDTSTTSLVSDIPIEMAVQLFVSIDSGIRAGDTIVASKMAASTLAKTYTGIAGEPYSYPSHLQVMLIMDDVEQ